MLLHILIISLGLISPCFAQTSMIPYWKNTNGGSTPVTTSTPLPTGIYGGSSAIAGNVLTSNGPDSLATFQAPAMGVTPIPPQNSVQFYLTSSSLGGSSNVFIGTSGSNIGIGTSIPNTLLEVDGGQEQALFGNGAATSYIAFAGTSTAGNNNGRAFVGYNGISGNLMLQGGSNRGIEFNINNGVAGSGTVAVIGSTGGFAIGTTIPVIGSALTINGLIASRGSLPTCGSNCSSINANSTNTRGSATSNLAVTSMVVSWNGTLTAAPFCTISQSGTVALAGVSTSTTALTINFAASVTSDVITWNCMQ